MADDTDPIFAPKDFIRLLLDRPITSKTSHVYLDLILQRPRIVMAGHDIYEGVQSLRIEYDQASAPATSGLLLVRISADPFLTGETPPSHQKFYLTGTDLREILYYLWGDIRTYTIYP